MGRFEQKAPQVLFFQREHPSRSVHTHNWSNRYEAISWYDPSLSGKLMFPSWRLLKEHLGGIRKSPLNINLKKDCYKEILRWAKDRKQVLFWDLLYVGNRIPGLGRLDFRRLDPLFNKIWLNIPVGSNFILVDEEQLKTDIFGDWNVSPFLEKNGHYWGLPKDDEEAIHALDRLRNSGASFIVFCEHTFWWLEHYKEFSRYLRVNFDLVVDDERCLILDLRKV